MHFVKLLYPNVYKLWFKTVSTLADTHVQCGKVFILLNLNLDQRFRNPRALSSNVGCVG